MFLGGIAQEENRRTTGKWEGATLRISTIETFIVEINYFDILLTTCLKKDLLANEFNL